MEPVVDEVEVNEGRLKKPVLGLRPLPIAESERALEIMGAIERYIGVGKLIPPGWIKELNKRLKGCNLRLDMEYPGKCRYKRGEFGE